jgi:hypothetical protein
LALEKARWILGRTAWAAMAPTTWLVPDVGGGMQGRPAVGFDRSARGDVGRDEAMQRGGGKVLDHGPAETSGRVGFHFDGG